MLLLPTGPAMQVSSVQLESSPFFVVFFAFLGIVAFSLYIHPDVRTSEFPGHCGRYVELQGVHLERPLRRRGGLVADRTRACA